jgi:ferredoxin
MVGSSLLDVALQNGVNIGKEKSCDGTCGCTECHVIISKDWYNKLPQTHLQEDLTLEQLRIVEKLTSNSRLACQITVEKEYDGLVVAVADDTSQFAYHFSYVYCCCLERAAISCHGDDCGSD